VKNSKWGDGREWTLMNANPIRNYLVAVYCLNIARAGR